MNSRFIIVYICQFILLLAVSSPTYSGGQTASLSSSEITQIFAGNTALCTKEKDQSTCSTYMGKDGLVKRYMHDTKEQRLGKWQADSSDHLCIRWDKKDYELCFEVKAIADDRYELYKKGKLKSTVSGFEVGDHSGF